MGKLLLFLVILLAVDLFIGLCIVFMIHHSQSDKPFSFKKDDFMFMLKGWQPYLFRLVFKREDDISK